MNKVIFLLIATVCCTGLFAQAPQKLSYQVVVRDSASKIVKNANVSVEISILKTSVTGQEVYKETHSSLTNSNGLLSLFVGEGSSQTGSLEVIDWTSSNYFLKSRVDPSGGTDYGFEVVSKMLSSPYAYTAAYSDSADIANTADTVNINMYMSSAGDTLFIGSGDQFVVVKGIPPSPCLPFTQETEIIEVTSAGGQVWMDRNLGAFRAATAADDEQSYGYHFQWGRAPDGHQCRDSDTITTQAGTIQPNLGRPWDGKFILTPAADGDWLNEIDNSLWEDVNAINNPCPSGFRLPTVAEWETEVGSWTGGASSSQNGFESNLKLPSAGYRIWTDGSIFYEEYGWYATSQTFDASCNCNWSNSSKVVWLPPSPNEIYLVQLPKAGGISVRCIKD